MGGIYFAYMGRRNPLTDWDHFFLGERYRWRKHASQIWGRSLKGFRGSCGSNFSISHVSVWYCKNLNSLKHLVRTIVLTTNSAFFIFKFEAPTPIRSWVMSDNVFWLPLKMRTRPLCMRRITWPVSKGSKTITFLESPTPICRFTIQLLLGYDED